jgi:hypothetical protein
MTAFSVLVVRTSPRIRVFGHHLLRGNFILSENGKQGHSTPVA